MGRILIIFAITFATSFHFGYGCQMEGVTIWLLPQSESILDTFRGNVVNRSTSSIEGISSISYGEGMNSGPYLELSHSDSRFLMWTNNAYENYEEYETEESMSVTVTFRCTGGTTNTLVFLVNVIDTNNNAPQFRPNNEFEFTVAPPLPPGFLVTGCFNDITVRDIDLTTQRIEFEIEENPYFEIEYDVTGSTVAKEFKAHLRTLTFIRSLPEPITLRISATDVDLTGDPPFTSNATIRITGDTEFEFPEEPVFNQTFYLANYTDDHQLVLYEPLSLQKGFDEFVTFSLEGEYSNHFELDINGNQVLLRVVTPLPATVLTEKQIFLVVRADREYTSGDTTTVIIRLPEEIVLKFESLHYTGSIVNNSLQLSPLVLSQGYEGGNVSATVLNEYSSYFTANVDDNLVTLTMTSLSDNIIEENNFISIQVTASTDRSSATVIVSLEIIKDDKSTPVFDKSIYTGSYNPVTGLTVEQIVFVQGFDESVAVYLHGEHASYFDIVQYEHIVTLTSSTIPPEIYSQQNILLSIEATKPRTVGATAAVVIALPEARILDFEASTYRGSLQDNVLSLESILLSIGYDENVNFNLTGDYANFFTVANVQNLVTIIMSTPLPDSVIEEDTLVILTLSASGLNALTTTTSVILDVIKEDSTTPVFNQNIYYGTYIGSSIIEIENINLAQGYDTSVSFRLEGDHSQYFGISNIDNNVILSLRSAVPEDVIFNEKVFLFNILADKALTVGANAAVLIRFPPEMVDTAVVRFSQNTYIGSLEDNVIMLEDIILDTGYATGTEFLLTGEYSEHFAVTNTGNIVQISKVSSLAIETVANNTFIVLELEARRQRAMSVWTSVIVNIVKQEIIPPIFEAAYYRGVYTAESGLQFDEEINLAGGWDDTVTFTLEGASAIWFSLTQNNNSLMLITNIAIPEAVLEDENQLLFTVVANKPNSVRGQAVVSIDLPKEDPVVLRFTQNHYIGLLHNGVLQLPTISIINDISNDDMTFNITGEYAAYFELSQELNDIRIEKVEELPEEAIYENAFLILDLEVSNNNAVRGYATIVIELLKDPEPLIIAPMFEKAYYVGEYSEQTGLIFEHTIQLVQGFDEFTTFTLYGDDSQWFTIENGEENSLRLSVAEGGIQTENKSKFIFSIVANKTNSLAAHAAIVISVTDFFTRDSLRFTQDYYKGSIQDGNLSLSVITLESTTTNFNYSLIGDFADYFQLTNTGDIFSLQIQTQLPVEILEGNNVLVLTIEVQNDSIRTHATVIIELLKDIDTEKCLAFEETYYVGSYSVEDGLNNDFQIRLADDHDETISFSLEGYDSQWFALVQSGNSVTLRLSNPIPAATLANNQHLIFVITARQNENAIEARATIVISLTADYADDSTLLGFDRVTYLGSIENDTASIQPITLTEGYTQNVTFTLHGELANYFSLSVDAATVNVALLSVIPEQSIPANRIIVLEIQASAPFVMPAYATIVFEYVVQDDAISTIALMFDDTYYTGSYTDATGLVFETPVTLSEGYHDGVQFALEGDNSQWFALVQSGNSVTLRLSNPIPAAILANNQHLIFVITARQNENAIEARATIVISLTADYADDSTLLGFDRVTYLGSIENDTASIQPITLTEGYTQNVTFTLHGELANYFSLSVDAATVNVALLSVIPEQSIPANRIIVQEIQASAPSVMPAYATIVFEYVVQDDAISTIALMFGDTYYTGSYTDATGLVFETPIALSEGYHDGVQFALEGDNSQWFSLVQSGNSVTLRLSNPIPAAILANNQHLIFVITARQNENAIEARATIVISLTADYADDSTLLGFDRVTYLGSIENDTASIQPITLTEGYTQNVTFTLHGELANYFSLSVDAATVNVALLSVIPEQSIPANRIIVLEIQASAPSVMPAYATIVFEYVVQDDAISTIALMFGDTYYTGSYTDATGLVFETPIALSEGYHDGVQFALEGDNSQWFSLVQSGNSVTLRLSNPIPAAILANNQHLIFVITARQNENAIEARATIVISLTADYADDSTLLGFDRVTYLGSIENDTASIQPITLTEGYTQNVTFTLHGELANYFSLSVDAATVNVALLSVIPEQSIPANRIIVLEIQASAPSVMPAYATIVFEYVVQDDAISTIALMFDDTYYTGSYTDATGLVFETPVTLSEGYHDGVQFALEGDNSQWFSLVQSGNSVTLRLSNPIPAAILANNQHLIFVITARQNENAIEARATIVISLTADYADDSTLLGFDRVTYLGSIENDTASIQPITLTEGYTQNVTFTLHGELANYFSLSVDAATVNVALLSVIPEQSIPANRIIVLEIQASAPSVMPAYATIVFEYVVQDDAISTIALMFDDTYYTGSYTDATGLVFETPVTLSEGYHDGVQFALEGDNSQWFSLVQSGNSVTLRLSNPIPAAILANNQHLIFVITARQNENAIEARATIVISLTADYADDSTLLGFDRVTYLGSIENDTASIQPITLTEGYTQNVTFTLHGELANYFSLSVDAATVNVALLSVIPEQSIPANRIIVLEIQASAPSVMPAYATIVFEYVVQDDAISTIALMFDDTYYTGSYTDATGLVFETPVTLSEGYHDGVQFALEGDNSQWFSLVQSGNSVTLRLSNPIPAAILANNQHLIFVITARQNENAIEARATIVISLTADYADDSTLLGFDRVTYLGSIENDTASIQPITLTEGYTQNVTFTLHGELANYFSLSVDAATVNVALLSVIPEQSIPANRIIVLEIQASAPSVMPAYATIVFEYVVQDDAISTIALMFDDTYYTGSYTDATGLVFETPVTLSEGYHDGVQFALEGDNSQWFSLVQSGNSVTLRLSNPIPAAILANNQHLIFVITARQNENATEARATIVISLTADYADDSTLLAFDRVTYLGSIENDTASIQPITLTEGYTQNVTFTLHGELANYFSLSVDAATVNVALLSVIPEQSIPANRIIVLEIQASAPSVMPAYATIVFEYVVQDDAISTIALMFGDTYYTGSYTDATGLVFETPIALSEGYHDGVQFALEGDNSQWFALVQSGNSVTLRLSNPIPAAILANNQHLIFVITARQNENATEARATIIVSLTCDTQAGSDVSFEKILYEGIILSSVVYHENIVVSNFTGANIEIEGEYAQLFVAYVSNGVVTVVTAGAFVLPADVTHIVLELSAANARAVLLLNVNQSDNQILPVVTFISQSYALRVEITQTGLVGQVHATADNGEELRYSLLSNNTHLLERLSINNVGELHLAAPVNTGVYTFQVAATTVFSQVTGTATVHLSVEAITVCGDDFVVPPLIILDRDEEEPHYDLINGTQYDGCRFSLTNRWPLDQTWLYVDETGLHARSIDREHESIAFMALSQVQVELILHCDSDDPTRTKRSLNSERLDWLGPYDYGTSKWILTDTILYNSRRSLVNLIVNDINDNAPIFVGKELEPIVVGYPVPNLESTVLPRSLAELQATDADIGENAALLYWSNEPELAVAPYSGFVHVRDGATLDNNTLFRINATDRNGEGLTGSIGIEVRLLDENNIAVLTVREAFLDDEQTILNYLRSAIGYEVRALRSVVISHDEDVISRRKRETNGAGASLQLFIYGLVEREPVSVDKLTTDISNNVIAAVNIASTVSLGDHLEAQEICVIPGRDTGLLAAIIVLSILLFIALVLIAVWFFLRWRKNRNYQQFSDANSLASRNESLDQFPKTEVVTKPRLNLEDLKKSERRLQEMLDNPIDNAPAEATTSRNVPPLDAILDMAPPAPHAPIVIQSIDKLKDAADDSEEDEFGEVSTPRRKSVVTFNENVEKIIHVEDADEDINTYPEYEIYKL